MEISKGQPTFDDEAAPVAPAPEAAVEATTTTTTTTTTTPKPTTTDGSKSSSEDDDSGDNEKSGEDKSGKKGKKNKGKGKGKNKKGKGKKQVSIQTRSLITRGYGFTVLEVRRHAADPLHRWSLFSLPLRLVLLSKQSGALPSAMCSFFPFSQRERKNKKWQFPLPYTVT